MKKENVAAAIENLFRKKVQKDTRLKNAYLLVHSDKLAIHINIAEGKTGDVPANPKQPNYMASVGKLFTSTLVSILYGKGKVAFHDKLNKFLDSELLNNLHVYKGKEYTGDIEIRHLLNHTSGLYDSFWPLVDELLKNEDFSMSPREALIWGKEHLKPKFSPGKKLYYTDTNYYLLGWLWYFNTKISLAYKLRQIQK